MDASLLGNRNAFDRLSLIQNHSNLLVSFLLLFLKTRAFVNGPDATLCGSKVMRLDIVSYCTVHSDLLASTECLATHGLKEFQQVNVLEFFYYFLHSR